MSSQMFTDISDNIHVAKIYAKANMYWIRLDDKVLPYKE